MLHALLVNPDFHRALLTTSFITDHEADVVFDEGPLDRELTQVARLFVSDEIPSGLIGFRLNKLRRRTARISNGLREYEADLGLSLSRDFENSFWVERTDNYVFSSGGGSTQRFEVAASRGSGRHQASSGTILSPMPGRIIAVDVAAGDPVTKGQKLLTLEAMKMEHSLTAPFDGVVAELNAQTGAQVQVDALLARIEAA